MRSILANIYGRTSFEDEGDLRFFSAEIAYFNFGSSNCSTGLASARRG